jgi:putative transposase
MDAVEHWTTSSSSERWRSVKYEEIHLSDDEGVPQAIAGLDKYFNFYNRERLHQSLKYQTPAAVYHRQPG